MRIRCSNELQVKNISGHFYHHPKQKNDLDFVANRIHVPAWDSSKSFSFQLSFKNNSDYSLAFFSNKGATLPTIQVAFAYSTPDLGDGPPRRWLRIHTVQCLFARTPADLYVNADPEIICMGLVHRTAQICLEDSLREARLRLKDWLVQLMLQVHCTQSEKDGTHPGTKSTTPATKAGLPFSMFPNLQILQQLVYGLLTGPVLGNATTTPDIRSSTLFAYTALHPWHLRRRLYPVFVGYGMVSPPPPGGLGYVPGLARPLSISAITGAQQKQPFSIDAGLHVLIYIRSEGAILDTQDAAMAANIREFILKDVKKKGQEAHSTVTSTSNIEDLTPFLINDSYPRSSHFFTKQSLDADKLPIEGEQPFSDFSSWLSTLAHGLV